MGYNKNRVLVLFAHPSQNRSEINVPLYSAATKINGVKTVDLYAEYPRFNINIEKEKKRLLRHNVIIFQFPLYWYSTPSILKEWQDLVLEYGFAYGPNGSALKGKLMLCALSAGGDEEAYSAMGNHHFTMKELLQPIEQMANLTQMGYIPPYCLFGANTELDETKRQAHVDGYRRLLHALVKGTIRTEECAQYEHFTNKNIQEIIRTNR